jgi:hypothetical protein
VVAVAYPLTIRYLNVIDDTSLNTEVHQQVISALGLQPDIVVEHVKVDGGRVTVDLTGTGTIPPVSTFEQDLAAVLGPDVTVTINRQ